MSPGTLLGIIGMCVSLSQESQTLTFPLPLQDSCPPRALQTPAFLFYPSNLVWCLQTVGRTGSAGKVQGTWGLWLTLGSLFPWVQPDNPPDIPAPASGSGGPSSSLQMTEEAWVLASNSLQSGGVKPSLSRSSALQTLLSSCLEDV